MEIKLFWLKVKRFFKRNAYSMAVGACSAIALVSVAMIAILVAMPTSTPETELPVETVTPTAIVFTSPIKDADISKEFAHDTLLEDKTSGYWQTHSGIDISADEGTSVLAVFDGVVESVEKSMMEGTIITINHANSLKTIYFRLLKLLSHILIDLQCF